MRYAFIAVLFFGCLMSEVYAKPKGRNRTYAYTGPVVMNATAQDVANTMAEREAVGHFGGNAGAEGCGSGATPDQAYRNCCFANSGMTTVDVGYAQSRTGRWYCCRRYR